MIIIIPLGKCEVVDKSKRNYIQLIISFYKFLREPTASI